jgi:hypothetical protein
MGCILEMPPGQGKDGGALEHAAEPWGAGFIPQDRPAAGGVVEDAQGFTAAAWSCGLKSAFRLSIRACGPPLCFRWRQRQRGGNS